ncbi:MAG TPA: prephenate dehydratase [Smithellaceae bacterium]|nr:prephenate dehydratase [Smithellaceae bacterium]
MKSRLETLRERMKEKDREIIKLLNERSGISVRIGEVKGEEGLKVYDPAQEAKVYSYLQELNCGPLPSSAVMTIFREIISASRSLQQPTTVAFLGPATSFSHLAAQRHFGNSSRFFPQPGIAHVFDDVEKGTMDWGVVPVENSQEGSVDITLDRLVLTQLKIRAEMFLRISQCLISSAKDLKRIKKIYSHPQALAQCQLWLKANLPQATLYETDSTAAAVRMVKGRRTQAAIGSSLAAAKNRLNVVAAGIEDSTSNTTRFLVIGNGESHPTGKDKTSLVYATPHSPGSLYRALAPFARRQINLIKIESHPVKERLWEYFFFVDIVGHIAEMEVEICLNELKKKTTFLKILGSYPRAEGVL